MSELDLTALYGMHDVLRREVIQLSRLTVRAGQDPAASCTGGCSNSRSASTSPPRTGHCGRRCAGA
jgi:hypothetical protein